MSRDSRSITILAIKHLYAHFISGQAIWLNDNLGPTIRNSAHSQVLIFGNDDQRYTYPSWFRKVAFPMMFL